MQTVLMGRRIFSPVLARSAADIIRERAHLPQVNDLVHNPACQPIDIGQTLNPFKAAHESHFGYSAISKVMPLVFGWSREHRQQMILDNILLHRLPSKQMAIPMVTLVDYINENVSGHPGLIHGGMTAIIAHSAMSLVAALNVDKPNQMLVSRSLNMDYRKPIRTGSFIKIQAWIYGSNSDGKLSAAVHFYSLEDNQQQLLVEAVSELEPVSRK